MARYTAAIANGGYLVTPYLSGEPPERQPIEGITPATLKIVRKAMYQVVYGNRGTGRRVQIDGIAIAAKTGTAQVPNRNNDAWFVAFAPYENPTIAIAAVIEGGGGGGAVAGPIVRQVIEAYFKQSGTADQAATDTLLTAH
jgi:penicillin-binding protein 2